MKVVSDKRAQDATEKLQKEKELSKIKVSKEDVELIVSHTPQLPLILPFIILCWLLNLNFSETFYLSNGLLFFCLGSRVGNFEEFS